MSDDALELREKLLKSLYEASGVEDRSEYYKLSAALDAKERRERIATAALQGMLASKWWQNAASYAVGFADALIAELDKPEEPSDAK